MVIFSPWTQVCPEPPRIIPVSDQRVASHLVLSKATTLPAISDSQKLELKNETTHPRKHYLLGSWASLSGYGFKK